MSSGTSTDPQTLPAPAAPETDPGLQPWQLFTLAGLVGATVVVFLSKGQTPAAVILLSLTIFAAAALGLAALRTFVPLAGEAKGMVEAPRHSRTRAALEREKALVLRSIKECEFDRAMGKMSEKDFAEMSLRLRLRAARLMRELDAGAEYREQIEREITRRIAGVVPPPPSVGPATPDPDYESSDDVALDTPARRVASPSTNAQGLSSEVEGRSGPAEAVAMDVCAACQTANDPDARFCKGCGAKLETGA
jgi:hypothetical protein